MAERSQSRGRDGLYSSGRGGAGNIRARSREPYSTDGPEDYSDTRGRELNPARSPTRREPSLSGRGGAGNLRPHSRDPVKTHAELEREKEVIEAKRSIDLEGPHSSGRGGYGNIDRSRSRDPPVRESEYESTGRGGYGNIVPDQSHHGYDVERVEHKADGVHSTGRGGQANITDNYAPPEGHVHHHQQNYESGGRGGAGNIRHSEEY